MNNKYLSLQMVRTSAFCAALSLSIFFAHGQSVQHLTKIWPGGMPGSPVVTGVQPVTNKLLVTWDGPSGYYQLFTRPNMSAPWTALGGRTNASRRALVSPTQSTGFFRVSGPAPKYAGSAACIECHRTVHTQNSTSPHARAFSSSAFAAAGGQKNASCLPCHTTGYGSPTGYKDQPTKLAGVQCEACHGPAAVHAANPDDPIYRPRVEVAATMCGGCHSTVHKSIYHEWEESAHADVAIDLNPPSRIDTCGRCHSGTVRSALINGRKLPSGDANHPLGCVACHNPHRTTDHPAQLRRPITSTTDFHLTDAAYSTQIKASANVSICGQCHNDRGATWAGTERPPHHSPQYNMMLGTTGEIPTGRIPAGPFSHAQMVEKQCLTCHMQRGTTPDGLENTGHNFKFASYDVCLECHLFPELLTELVQGEISINVVQLKAALDNWALTKAHETLRSRYGVRAWEYTSPGSLSSGGVGPSKADQALVPEVIKKARFNIYLILNDGSLGVHNPTHTARLLKAAEDYIKAAMNL